MKVLCASIISHYIIIGSVLIVSVTPGLVVPVERTTGQGCIPEGRNVSYVCTVIEMSIAPIGSTVWLGTAFDCPLGSDASNNRITLNHNQFLSGGTVGVCGDLSAMSIEGENYTSRLTLSATTGLNGKTIMCTLSGNTPVIGTDTLVIGGLPPLPQSALVDITSTSSLTVSWTPPSDISNVKGYMLTVTGEDCGCVSVNVSSDTTNVLCSGWMVNNQTCSFEVRTVSQDCGFTSDPVKEILSLIAPSTPTNLTVSPVYNRDGSARHIDVQFTAVDEPSIGANISNTVSYTVMIGSLSSTRVQCNTSNQQCTLRVPGSQLTEDGLLNVSVVASNAVGSGDPANFPTTVATNIVTQDIASVTIDVLQSTVTCNLLTSYQQTPNATCSITYGPSPNNCSLMSNFTSAIPNSSSILHLLEFTVNVEEFCYTVKLDHGSTVLSITGTFRSQCDPEVLGTDPSPQEGAGSVTVPNGTINYNGSAPGFIATLVCNEGYSVADEINRTCMSDGHWSDETLECIQNPTAATPARCGEACAIATSVSVFGVMFILIVFCVIMALYLCKYRKDVCAGNVKVIDDEVANINQNVNSSSSEAKSTFTPENDSAPCDKPEVTLKPQVEMYAAPINLVPLSGKESSKRQVEMYADPNDIIPTPQLPPRNYEEGECVNVPVQDTGQSKLVEEATKPNSSQLPQELYSEVFNALPKGMAPKVVRNGPKN